MLLEALIAILVFSLGILTVVALQATSIKLTGDAKYRTNATLLANQLIGRMWVRTDAAGTLKTNFEPGGSAYNTWLAEVSGPDGLPGVVAASGATTSTLPTVAIVTTPVAGVGEVSDITITLFWRTPEMPLGAPGHRHVVTTQIARNI